MQFVISIVFLNKDDKKKKTKKKTPKVEDSYIHLGQESHEAAKGSFHSKIK